MKLPALRAALIILCVLLGTNTLRADEPSTGSGNEGCQNEQDTGDGCSTVDESEDVGSAPSGNSPGANAGNPINLMTGNKFQKESDFSLPGATLSFNRLYNSSNADNNLGMGQGWHHSYAVTLYDGGNGSREIVQSNGSRIVFKAAGEDEQGRAVARGSAPHYGYVVQGDTHFEWHLPDSRTLLFQGSYLVRIDWPDQRQLDLFYRANRLHSVTDETGRVLRFDYYAGASRLTGFEAQRFGELAGHLSRLTLPDGSYIEYDYDQNRNLTRTRYPDGSSREYHYENGVYTNHLTGLTDRTGVRFASWRYDQQGRAISSERAGGVGRVSAVFPDPKAVANGEVVTTVMTNALGHESRYTWQQSQAGLRPLLLSSTGAGCRYCPPTGMDYTYDAQGRLERSTKNSLGNAVGQDSRTYRYDEQGRIVEIRRIDVGGSDELLERREYSDTNSLLPVRIAVPSVRPNELHVREFEYDEVGNALSITERGWAPVLNNESLINASAHIVDAITRWEPIERVIGHQYDSVGRLIAVDGPRADVDDTLRITWDERNRPLVLQSPGVAPITATAFNQKNQITRFTIGEQSPISIEYDAASRVRSVTQYSRTLQFGYDAEGRITSYQDPDSARHYLRYDDAGQLTKIIEPDGTTTRFERDGEGRIVNNDRLDRDGTLIRSIASLYGALGKLSSTTTDTLSAQGNFNTHTLVNNHNDSGQRVAVTNRQSGDELIVEYTDFGALASISEPSEPQSVDGNTLDTIETEANRSNGRAITRFEYDAAGNEIALSDARGQRTVYLKDDFHRVVVHHSGDTGTSYYDYDLAGNRIRKQDADGDVTTYRWDVASRMVQKQRVDGLYSYAYDPKHGKLVESIAPATTERFAYDERARLISHERLIDGRRFTTTYRYDEDGRLSHKTLPDGQTLRFHYVQVPGPTRGNLLAITRETLFGLTQQTIIEQIDLDTGDGSGGYVASNGLRTLHQYAPDGSITGIDIDRVMNLKYEFDDAGRIVGIDQNGTLQRYGYSRIGLSMAEQQGTVYRFDYDVMGNRTASSIQSNDGSFTATRHQFLGPAQGNRLLDSTTYTVDADESSVPQRQTTSQRYTRSGAPEYAGHGYRYEYDSAQRPIKVYENDQLLAEYAYSGFGERIKKVVYRGDQKKVTYYLYDGHQLSAEIDSESGKFKQGVFLEGAPVAYLVGSDTYAVHSDHLGTPRVVTDTNGETVWSADYTPFGQATISTTITRASKTAIELPYRLPGQYFDAETGTHYNYLRDYDPATGRYITSDPIGLQGGLNTYAYALNNPLSLIDPLGLSSSDSEQGTATGADAPDVPTAVAATEQAYTDKLAKVLHYAIADLTASSPGDAAIGFLQDMATNVAFMGTIIAAVAAAHAVGGPVALAADAVLLAGAWLLGGYAAGKFLYDTVTLMLDLKSTDLCDEAKLKGMGEQFAGSIGTLGAELAESLLLGGISKLAGALKDAAQYASEGAWTLWRRLRERFGRNDTIAGLCSFAGDTLVLTDGGRKPIRDIRVGDDRVWARSEQTGDMGWRDVLAQYSNRYEETVHVTAIDDEGNRHRITSNRIHPYFARVAAGAMLATASVSVTPAIATEGHVYKGEIAGGAWIDAQYLQPGDELLTQNNEWQKVDSVAIIDVPLEAYNLTVDQYATYFVAGDEDSSAVWVHNKCFDSLPNGYTNTGEFTPHGQPIFRNADGVEVYKGHDGRFYNRNDHPPTENGVDGPKPETVATARTELPEGYSQREDGTIFGPRGGEYTPVEYDSDGYQIYQNGSSYSTFRDGKPVSELSPRPPTTTAAVGLRGERRVTEELGEQGWSPIGNTQRSNTDFDQDLPNYQGTNGIDGIYTRQRADGSTEYIIVETKATQGNSAGGLNTMSDNTTQQMSTNWINGRIADSGLTTEQVADLRSQIESNNVTFVKADVTGVRPDAPEGPGNGRVTFKELNTSGDTGVTTGNTWDPNE